MADARPRTGFAPTVLLGLATAALTSVASAKPWMSIDVPARLMPGVSESDRTADLPLALALSLTVLAGWGAILVSRGLFRRIVCGYAVVAALAVVGCFVTAPFVLPDNLRENIGLTDKIGVSPTSWFVVGAVTATGSVLSLVVAWVQMPGWPTMSSRYDAPATRSPQDETDLWKALDEGRDPTDPAGPSAQ